MGISDERDLWIREEWRWNRYSKSSTEFHMWRAVQCRGDVLCYLCDPGTFSLLCNSFFGTCLVFLPWSHRLKKAAAPAHASSPCGHTAVSHSPKQDVKTWPPKSTPQHSQGSSLGWDVKISLGPPMLQSVLPCVKPLWSNIHLKPSCDSAFHNL